jgi:hypothetical protein
MKDRHNKGRISGPFVPMVKATMNEPAWRALSHGARSLYAALKSRYNSKLGNAVYLSSRAAVKELGSHSCRDSIQRWFRELQYYGFTVMVSAAHLGVEGRGKAPHWRLTEEWYLGEPPTRNYQQWDGTVFHRQKPPEYYKRREFITHKKQNPGPPIQSTLDHPSSSLVDHPSSPPPSRTGPPIQSIQPVNPGPPIQSITSLTTPHLEKRSGEQGYEQAGASLQLEIPDDLSIPRFLLIDSPRA